jgi:hypothetical protein
MKLNLYSFYDYSLRLRLEKAFISDDEMPKSFEEAARECTTQTPRCKGQGQHQGLRKQGCHWRHHRRMHH